VGEILLIASDWRFRALVRAQLLEEGYAVRALPSLGMAQAHLVQGGEAPRLIILDLTGTGVGVGDVWTLWRLATGAPLLLSGGNLNRAVLDQAHLPPAAKVLRRPFRVGDLTDQVRKAVEWSEEETSRDSTRCG
jgi:DNA-binding NtrC family response regulator